MTIGERRAAFSLASIFSLRMLGLFMIVPVFALYAQELDGYSATLAGVAIGIYGLTQAILQIPLGMFSDRIGRKPVIIGGLLVFALGSVVAAVFDTMIGVIIGRALQGAGAIASAVMALAADLTREEQRIKIMAIIGMSIGLSFLVAMMLGPVLQGWIGVSGIFWFTALLAMGGIGIVKWWVPQAKVTRFHRDTEFETHQFWQILSDPQLLRLDLGILLLHMTLTATFMAAPLVLRDKLGLSLAQHWQIYVPVLLFSMLAVIPFIFLGLKTRRLKPILVGSIALLALAAVGMRSFSDSLAGMFCMFGLYFSAFNLLEASLPSLVAKIAPAAHRGTAMGVYSSAQFLGVFLGGVLGGWLSEAFDVTTVFVFNGVIAGIWILLAMTMRSPSYLSSELLNVGRMDEIDAKRLARRLTQVHGVAEAVVMADEGVAYLKVDKNALDSDSLYNYSASKA